MNIHSRLSLICHREVLQKELVIRLSSFVSSLSADLLMLLVPCLQNLVVYNDLNHPPATNIGNKYAYRTADGSRNNPNLPDMGKVRCLCQWSRWSSIDLFYLLIGRSSLFSIGSANKCVSRWSASRSQLSLWCVCLDWLCKFISWLVDVDPVCCDVMKLVPFLEC